jgi:hypothetical protein
MSWFKRIPHRREESRRVPHHTSPMSQDLMREIEDNHKKLEEHRKTMKEIQHGKLHR